MKNEKTQFEIAQEQAAAGTLKTPVVGTATGRIDYFGYQIAVHNYNLSLMAKGMKFRQITFTQIKKYYGLKGRSAAECLPQFIEIVEAYKLKLQTARLVASDMNVEKPDCSPAGEPC